MADIYKFNKDDEEPCECSRCLLVSTYLKLLVNAGIDEYEDLLRGLLEEGYQLGMTEMLMSDIEAKRDLLYEILHDDEDMH